MVISVPSYIARTTMARHRGRSQRRHFRPIRPMHPLSFRSGPWKRADASIGIAYGLAQSPQACSAPMTAAKPGSSSPRCGTCLNVRDGLAGAMTRPGFTAFCRTHAVKSACSSQSRAAECGRHVTAVEPGRCSARDCSRRTSLPNRPKTALSKIHIVFSDALELLTSCGCSTMRGFIGRPTLAHTGSGCRYPAMTLVSP